MADEEIKYTKEDLERIDDLLELLDRPSFTEVFNPMTEQFNADLQELRRRVPEAGEETLPTGEEQPEMPDAGMPELTETGIPAGEEPGGDLFPTEGPLFGEPEDESDRLLDELEGLTAQADEAPFEPSEPITPEITGGEDFGEIPGGIEEPTTIPGVEEPFEPVSEPGEPVADEFDLSSLTDTDFEAPPEEEFDMAPPVEGVEEPLPDFDLGGEEETPPEEAGGEPVTDFDFGGEEETPAEDYGAEPTPEFDLGGEETPAEDFGAGPTPEFDLGGEETPIEDFGAGPTPEFDLGGEETPAEDFGTGPTADFDFGGEETSIEDFGAGPTTDFDLGGDLTAEPMVAPDLGGIEEAAPSSDLDFSGLDTLGDLESATLEEDLGTPEVHEPIPESESLMASDDFGESMLESGDLDDMSEKARMFTGIGDDFSDEELASIRTNLNEYPNALKRAIIDLVVNEKISQNEQRLLINMVIEQAYADQIADFIQQKVGYRPDISAPELTQDGIPIIYAEGVSPEDMARRRKKAKILILLVGVGVLSVLGFFGVRVLLFERSVRSIYEEGLEKVALAGKSIAEPCRSKYRNEAEALFNKALNQAGGRYNVEFLNRYGIAYLKSGCYDDAFTKLFGRVKPDYGLDGAGRPHLPGAWNRPGRRAPLIRFAVDGAGWTGPRKLPGGEKTVPEGKGIVITARDNIRRRVEVAGAFIVDRLRDGKMNRTTLLNLARFHSHTARNFTETRGGHTPKYKNDGLAIDYYRLILTLLERPDDVGAIAGIAGIHYHRKEFGEAARYFNKIIEKHPQNIVGHAGLLNTYLEIWEAGGKRDPRWVIARHRLLQKMDLEKELPIYIMTKLAGFYIDLDADDVRIKYQIDPRDQMTGLSIHDNARHLQEMVFFKKERRDEEIIEGRRYGEGFYQRGRYLLSQGKYTRALQQFQNAHQYDPRHYLAVNAMGEFYKRQMDFVRAREYFETAEKIHDEYSRFYGTRPEDETLIKGDVGIIYYNLGSLLFLRNSGVADPSTGGFPDSRLYPLRALNQDERGRRRRELLNQARVYFEKALQKNLKDPRARVETVYWMGWIDYINGNFQNALRQWARLDVDTMYDRNYSDPVLLMGRANAYYYTNQLRSALGNYNKVLSDYERKAVNINRINPANKGHLNLYITLSAVYNNIGAVYEKEYIELLGERGSRKELGLLEETALQNYFLSIDAARKIDYDNEIARTNQSLAFKYLSPGRRLVGNQRIRQPLIDDWLSPILPGLKK